MVTYTLIIYTLLHNITVYHTKHIYGPTDSLQFYHKAKFNQTLPESKFHDPLQKCHIILTSILTKQEQQNG